MGALCIGCQPASAERSWSISRAARHRTSRSSTAASSSFGPSGRAGTWQDVRHSSRSSSTISVLRSVMVGGPDGHRAAPSASPPGSWARQPPRTTATRAPAPQAYPVPAGPSWRDRPSRCGRDGRARAGACGRRGSPPRRRPLSRPSTSSASWRDRARSASCGVAAAPVAQRHQGGLAEVGFEDGGGPAHHLRIAGGFIVPDLHVEGTGLGTKIAEGRAQRREDRAPFEKGGDDQHAGADQHRRRPLLIG